MWRAASVILSHDYHHVVAACQAATHMEGVGIFPKQASVVAVGIPYITNDRVAGDRRFVFPICGVLSLQQVVIRH